MRTMLCLLKFGFIIHHTQNYRIKYCTIEIGEYDIHLSKLRDSQQFYDHNQVAENLGIYSGTWSLFGQVWDSSIALANLMVDYEIKGKKILEVGCGMALASLVLNMRDANITASDHHPEVKEFLVRNSKLNRDKAIPFVLRDWSNVDDPTNKYDLIIGSDLLYERDHAMLLSQYLNLVAHDKCEIIIADPGRGYVPKLVKEMTAHGFSHKREQIIKTDSMADDYSGTMNYLVR